MLKSEDSYTDAATEGQSSSSEHKRHAETAQEPLESKSFTAHTFLMKLCPWQCADRELLPVSPVPPGRRPGDPVGGRCFRAARVYEIVNGSQFCFQSLSRDEREFL